MAMIEAMRRKRAMAIVETDLAEALRAWGDGLVAVSEAYDADGIEAARPIASDMLDDLYALLAARYREANTKQRKTVLAAIDDQLSKMGAAA